jgi:hypothetical protein
VHDIAAAEETDIVERARRGIFEMKSKTTRDILLVIGSKLSEAVLKLEPLLIVLELISNDFGLKLLLMKVLSVAVQDYNCC